MVGIHNAITYANFGDDRLRDLEMAVGQILSFPTGFRRRHYNTHVTVRMCDKNVYDAVVRGGHCESLAGSFDECKLSARWPPTLKPN